MAVNRYNQPLERTPQQTYVSQRIDIPFDDIRRDLDAAQLEQDTNRAQMLTQQAAALEAVKTYEGAAQEAANERVQVYNDQLSNMLDQPDLRGMQGEISKLAADFGKDLAVGELYNLVEENKINYEQWNKLKDAPAGQAFHESLNLKHEQNKNSQHTGNFNRIQEYVYDDKDVQSQLAKIVDAKDRTLEYESDVQELEAIDNLRNNLGGGVEIAPLTKEVTNADGTKTQSPTGLYKVTTTKVSGLKLNRAELNALGNALASEAIYNRALLEEANEIAKTQGMDIDDAISAAEANPDAIRERITDDIVGRVAGAAGYQYDQSGALKDTRPKGGGSGDKEDKRFVANYESPFYDIQKKTPATTHGNNTNFFKTTWQDTGGKDMDTNKVVANYNKGLDHNGAPLEYKTKDGAVTTVPEIFDGIDSKYDQENYQGVNGTALARLEKDKVLVQRMIDGFVPGEDKENTIATAKAQMLEINNSIDELNQKDIEFKKRFIKQYGEEEYNNYLDRHSKAISEVKSLYENNTNNLKTEVDYMRGVFEKTKAAIGNKSYNPGADVEGLDKKQLTKASEEIIDLLSGLYDEDNLPDTLLGVASTANEIGTNNNKAVAQYLLNKYEGSLSDEAKTLLKARNVMFFDTEHRGKNTMTGLGHIGTDSAWGGDIFTSSVEDVAENNKYNNMADKIKEGINTDWSQNNLIERNTVRYPKGITMGIPDKQVEGKLVERIEKLEENMIYDPDQRGTYTIRSADGQKHEGIKGTGDLGTAEQAVLDMGDGTKLVGEPRVKGYYQVGEQTFQVVQREYKDEDNKKYFMTMNVPVSIDFDVTGDNITNMALDYHVEGPKDTEVLVEKIDTDSSPEFFLDTSAGLTNDYFKTNYGSMSIYHPTEGDARGNKYMLYIGKNVQSNDEEHKRNATRLQFRDKTHMKATLKAIQGAFSQYNMLMKEGKQDSAEAIMDELINRLR